MLESAKEYVKDLWWLIILQGIVTVLFGVVALFMPGLTLTSLLLLFGAYILVVGVIEIVHGFVDIGKNSSWWFSLLVGVVLLGTSIYLIRNPGTALTVFVIVVGALLLARGVFDFVIATFFVGRSDNRWLWAISGVIGVVAGVVVWRYPLGSSLAFVWVLGFYAVLAGIISIAYALRIRTVLSDVRDEPVRLARNRR
jgi:uncharacterized membrane protein HdeD (DUF308 family)